MSPSKVRPSEDVSERGGLGGLVFHVIIVVGELHVVTSVRVGTSLGDGRRTYKHRVAPSLAMFFCPFLVGVRAAALLRAVRLSAGQFRCFVGCLLVVLFAPPACQLSVLDPF